jgi:Uncharacterized alpha/beta hydrolase domain (DUF2235)
MAIEPLKPTSRPGKRLALFFDGTWNEPPDHTNVRRLRLMLAERSPDGIEQRAFYNAGVGTRWYDRLSGGLIGTGLSENVRDGYRWLVENYDEGDEIYLFGFSRGAFTARSLAGIIARCGLLRADSPISFAQLFERYKQGDTIRTMHDLLQEKEDRTSLDFEERALLEHTYYRRNLIRMVGVWDTVGSIGLPFGRFPGLSRRMLKFHNTNLSTVIEHSYQALAMDEYRSPYWAVLWTEFRPVVPDRNDMGRPDQRWIEQRWFPGAHANVGGGYRDDPLPNRPLIWMQQKALGCGLAFRRLASPNDRDLLDTPRDSYGEFLHGLWPTLSMEHRYVRWVKSAPVRKVAAAETSRPVEGWVQTVNERIDESVWRMCQRDGDYRPLGLKEWAARTERDLEALIAQPAEWAPLMAAVTGPGVEWHGAGS